MPDLTNKQMDVLVECVRQHELNGFSTPIGEYHENSHEHARALVRAGMADFYPPFNPIPRMVAKRAGKTPYIVDMIKARHRITPTPKGRKRVAEHARHSQAQKKTKA